MVARAPGGPAETGLTSDQQQRVDAALDLLLDLSPAARASRLETLQAEDPAVAAEVASLLEAADACGDFLSRPATPASPVVVAPGLDAGARIGAWRVVREIGYGGMGEVYEAERVDGGFAQRAALKLLRREARDQLARFHAERQILARLEHRSIARLLDGGVAPDGRPYMAMELVEGASITEYCDAKRATLDERLALFVQVCDAVAFAHHHLVVHRDLKPSNILVDGSGEVRLLDFGIAKLLDPDGSEAQTRSQVAPLTPLYASPEQLTGGSITTASDVYALGLLLFELLTGTPAWSRSGTAATQIVRALSAETAPVPSERARANVHASVPARLLQGDLDAIVARALRSEPGHRYATVDAMRRDIGLARRGEAITAREGARLYAAGRLLRRYRWAAASAAAVFVALAIGLFTAAWQAHRAAAERDVALRNAAREEALRYQIMGLFRGAIADHGSAAPTAKTMLDKSAQRVLREYRDQPQLAGQVVLTLVDLYEALEDVQGSAALLEGFLAEPDANADPFAVADARQKLAGIELMRGHVDKSGQLLDQAEAYWAHEDRPHVEERLEGLGVRARWLRAHGDLDAAIAADRQAIAQRIALSGRDHRETATLYNSLAISLAAANRLDEALAAYKDTTAIYDRLGLGDGLDAQIIRGNTGTLALRIGHLGEAETLLKGAVDHERALAGDSAAVAASMGYLGKLLSITDRPQAAIATLTKAVDLGIRYAGAASPVGVQNRVFLGEAQLAAGDTGAARTTLEPALADALARYGPSHALTLRAGIALAAVETAEGHASAARARLGPLVETLRRNGAQAHTTLASALGALADASAALHDPASAVAALREAVQLRAAGWADNWELAVARERLAEVLAASGAATTTNEVRAVMRVAASVLQDQLGPRHPETLRARRALARLAA